MKYSQRLYSNRKGLSLGELIVTLAIVPGLLLAASTFYGHIAKTMRETSDRGNTITHREQIVNMLQRQIANGTSAEAPDMLRNLDGTWSSELTLTMPNGDEAVYILEKNDDFPYPILMSCNENRSECEQLNYSGTNTVGDSYAGWMDIDHNNPDYKVFDYNSDKKTVTVNLLFYEKDNNQEFSKFPISFSVKLRGGQIV